VLKGIHRHPVVAQAYSAPPKFKTICALIANGLAFRRAIN